jgi:hypothetical protein
MICNQITSDRSLKMIVLANGPGGESSDDLHSPPEVVASIGVVIIGPVVIAPDSMPIGVQLTFTCVDKFGVQSLHKFIVQNVILPDLVAKLACGLRQILPH